ncbi:hypothetical protein RaK2_00438 [Klebsiella phage vB_KleM_RaK2]|uniref:Uncharacterized protein n=1 Tax=Klebsiella phage vB_KleM_RaK2 TaxID=1147094 RepID=H6X4P5_9CAUD|nr:hypothetical protein F403_gp097 [Klebsiella phage vB_KleM_RaK2]AFA44711.1 hypothetical protein RaK2_00438 [Klebsiella phage vB_KleM_RaK2]
MPTWCLPKNEKMLTQPDDSVYKCIEHFDYFINSNKEFIVVDCIPLYFIKSDSNTIKEFNMYYGSEFISIKLINKYLKNSYSIESYYNGIFLLGISNEYINSVLLKSNTNKPVYADREAFNEIDFFQYTCGDAYIPLHTNTMCLVKDKLLEIENDFKKYY